MTTQRVFIVGNLMLAGCGVILVGVFGARIYYQYAQGGTAFFATDINPVIALFVLYALRYGFNALCVAVGFVCLAASIFLPVRRRKRLFEREP